MALHRPVRTPAAPLRAIRSTAWVLAAFTLCAATAVARPQGNVYLDNGLPYRAPRDRTVQFEHMDLQLRLDPAERAVAGTVTYRVRAAGADLRPSFSLDGVDLQIQSAHWLDASGNPGPDARVSGDALRFQLPAGAGPHRLRLAWTAKPRRGLYRVAPDADEKARPMHLWTQGETQEARHWVPCPDDPDARFAWDVTLDVPRGQTALSNGDPGEVLRKDGRTLHRFTMRAPHPIYLLNVVVGPFQEVVHATGPVRVSSWAMPADVARAKVVGAELPAMIAFLGKVTGTPYPHARYGQVWVDEFTAGGMENVTLTTLTRRALGDADADLDWRADGLLAHEAAHQWFGDTVTCRTWADLWLNEGFATYYQKLWTREHFGEDRFAEEMAGARDAAVHTDAATPRAVVQPRYERPGDLFDAHSYSRGGWVLHMLREQLGHAVFDAGIADYLKAHRFGSVETGDLRRALEHRSHRSLREFFDRWVHTPGLPKLTVRANWRNVGGGRLTIEVRQTQPVDNRRPAFALRVPVLVADAPDAPGTVHHVVVEGARGALTLPLAKPPAVVMPDPTMTLLAEWKLEIDADLLLGALRPHRHPDARARAVHAMRGALGRAKVVQALLGTLASDSARHVRAAAARALGSADRSLVRAGLQAAAQKDAEASVRAAAVAALGELHDTQSAPILLAATRERSTSVVREALGALQHVDRKAARQAAIAASQRSSWRSSIAGDALGRLAAIADPRDLERVWDASRPGHDKALRATAAVALAHFAGTIEAARDAIRDHLEGLLHESSTRLRSAAVSALAIVSDPRSREPLLQASRREAFEHLAEQMRQTAKGLGKGVPLHERVQRLEEALGKLRDQMQTMRSENKRGGGDHAGDKGPRGGNGRDGGGDKPASPPTRGRKDP
ncbi:MAG: hypothetical protein RIT45_244 [Pseudomonadota bacterium]|jgi:aminopeptidase N